MALVAETLGSGLANMTPTDSESDAINAFATAFEDYFANAVAGAIGVTPGSLSGATAALKTAMVGVSQPDQGAVKIQAGITAFWGVVATSAATIFIAVPPATAATPPTTLATIAGLLTATFEANVSGKLSLIDSANAVADEIHTTQLGGICTFPPIPTGLGPLPIT